MAPKKSQPQIHTDETQMEKGFRIQELRVQKSISVSICVHLWLS